MCSIFMLQGSLKSPHFFCGTSLLLHRLKIICFLQPGFKLDASDSLKGQTAQNGHYSYPGKGHTTVIPVSGIMFMNITATSCAVHGNSHLPLPDGVVLKPHHYFGFRPRRTNLYSMFDRRNWAAHLGMGDEPSGWAIAGMTLHPLLQLSSCLSQCRLLGPPLAPPDEPWLNILG